MATPAPVTAVPVVASLSTPEVVLSRGKAPDGVGSFRNIQGRPSVLLSYRPNAHPTRPPAKPPDHP